MAKPAFDAVGLEIDDHGTATVRADLVWPSGEGTIPGAVVGAFLVDG